MKTYQKDIAVSVDARIEAGEHKVDLLRGAATTVAFFISHYPIRTFLVAVCTLFIVAFEAVGAAALLPLLEVGFENPNLATVPFQEVYAKLIAFFGMSFNFYTILSVAVLAWLAKIGVNLLMGIYVDYSTELIAKHFRERVIAALSKASLSLFHRQSSGVIVNLLNQEADRAASVFSIIKTLFLSALTFVLYMAVGIVVSFEMMIGVLIFSILSLGIVRPLFKMSYQAGRGQVVQLRAISDEIMKGLLTFKTFKAMAREQELLSELEKRKDALVKSRLMKVKATRFMEGSQELLILAALVIGLVFGLEIVGLDLTEIAFMILVFMKSFTHLANFQKKFQGLSSLQFVHARFEETVVGMETAEEKWKGTKTVAEPFSIVYEHVSFVHDRIPVLDGVVLELSSHGMTAIIGPSGSGKTTLVDLLCGFYMPTEGSIKINGVDLSDLDIKWWRSHIGYVTQSPTLLDDSIYKNVAAFSPNVSVKDAENALKKAGVWQYISQLPEGIHSAVGEAGVRLSGGEKQRIAVARSLAQKPKLLIMDEPTSSVDPETEKVLLDTFKNLKSEITIIAISHQPGIAEVADQVLRMQDGVLCPVNMVEA